MCRPRIVIFGRVSCWVVYGYGAFEAGFPEGTAAARRGLAYDSDSVVADLALRVTWSAMAIQLVQSF